jgi:Domain of unknown function (DUF5667)/Domain of unknown function (DUF5666)
MSIVDDRILEAFEDCLARLQSGASLEQVLALYPAWKQELRPMLLAAQAARQAGAGVRVPRAALVRSRSKFLQKANQMAAGRARLAPRIPAWRFALVALMVVLVLASGMVTTVAVSAHALPGDVLYPVKIAAEQTRLLLVENPLQRMQLEQSFDQERVAEVDTLIHRASSRDVQFAGGLKAMQGNTWQVGDIPVRVTDATHILSAVKPGYYVDVEGRLQPDGVVMAYQIAPRAMQLSGTLTILAPDEWRVGNLSVRVEADTAIQGEPYSGGQVVVQTILLDGGKLQAVSAVIKGAPNAPFQVSATSQPSNTASPQPSVTAEPTDTRQPRPTEIERPQSTSEPTEIESPKNTPKPTQGEDHHDTPEPTESEDHHKTPQPTEDDHHEDQQTPRPTRAPSTPQPTEQEGSHHASPTPTLSGSAGNPTPTPGGHDD